MAAEIGTQPQATMAPARLARSDALYLASLAGVILVLYASSLRFGLIWDDPIWYQQGAGRTVWQIFTALNTTQFYRPLAILLNRQLISADGVVNAPLAHALQITAHLVATLVSVPVLRAFKFNAWHARLAALFFAIYPLSYQAVAWPAPQQAFVTMWVLLAVWAAYGYVRRQRLAWLGLSGLAYATALLFQESALPLVALFFLLAVIHRGAFRRYGWAWPLLHLTLALLYAGVWLSVPRKSGVTGTGFQFVSLTYLLQGVVFVPAHLVAGWVRDWPTIALFGLFVLIGLMLVAGAWLSQGRLPASVCCVWVGVGLLAPWAGLSWDYVQLGSRLTYPASVGIAGLWGAWAAQAFTGARPWSRGLGWATLLLVSGVSLQQWYQFQGLYQSATAHLADAVQILAQAPGDHLLFVNFPDRLEFRPAPYPLGVWGITLAPVVQDLSDFARAERGPSAADRSLAVFRVGLAERSAGLYEAALRGADSDPATVLAQARWADQVYLSDYDAGGPFRLNAVGHVLPQFSGSPPLARLGAAVELGRADLSAQTGLTLNWRVLAPLHADDTIFIHYWKDGAFVAAQDGDSLAGLLPPGAWQPGTEVVDIRPLRAAQLGPGRFEVRVGLYHRGDGARYPAYAMDGARYPNDEIPVGTFSVP